MPGIELIYDLRNGDAGFAERSEAIAQGAFADPELAGRSQAAAAAGFQRFQDHAGFRHLHDVRQLAVRMAVAGKAGAEHGSVGAVSPATRTGRSNTMC
jgi:hypothetical protein